MNDEELLRRMTALRAAGATEAEIEAAVAEWDAPSSPLDAIGPLTADRQAADRTNRPFHTAAEAREAHKTVQGTNAKDFRATLATMLQGASFGFADDVLPEKFGQSIDYLKQRAPDIAKGAHLAGGLIGPGVGSLKAIKALRPSTVLGQVATGAGIGAANTGLEAAGNTEGGVGERIAAGLDAAPVGAVVGGAVGLLPAALVAGKKTVDLVKKSPATAKAGFRTARRVMTGRRPELTDLMQLGNAGRNALKAKGQMFTGPADDILLKDLPSKQTRRLNAGKMLEGTSDVRPSAALAGEGTPPKRLADIVAKRMDGEAPPLTGSPSVAQQVLEETDDPIVRAMAQQVETPAPLTPKPSVPRGKVTAKAERVAEMKARSLAGDFPKEAELKGLTLAERLEARGGAEVRAQLEPRGELSDYLKRHSRGSAQRRGELPFDARMNPEAEAAKQALQAQADAIPPGPEGETLRDALYKQWKALKEEYGQIGPLTFGGAAAAAGGALTAALAARKRDR